jgi:hypothetical protein
MEEQPEPGAIPAISGVATNSKNAAPADGATFSFDSCLRAYPASVTPGHMRLKYVPVPLQARVLASVHLCPGESGCQPRGRAWPGWSGFERLASQEVDLYAPTLHQANT